MYQIRMMPGTYYVPDTYDTRYVLCTRYVCTTLAVVLLIVQLYRYLYIRAKRVSNNYIQRKKSVICACVRNIGFSGGSVNRIQPKHGIPSPV